MSVYSYPQSKVIDEITFIKSEGGHARAYLRAVAGADPKVLYDITCKLADRGWQVTPYSLKGKPVLEVQGFRRSMQCLKVLEEAGWVQGKSNFTPGKEDKTSLTETIKRRSLAASGAFYLIGDSSFATYGYKGGSALNALAGGLYGAGTLSLLMGGRKDQSDLQVSDISKKMADHFRALDIQLPPNCSLESISQDHKKGLIRKADDLIRRYPSELMNLFFAAAGMCIMAAAYKGHIRGDVSSQEIKEVFERKLVAAKKNFPHSAIAQSDVQAMHRDVVRKMKVNYKREGWLDIGLGGMTALSGLFAMMVKEKRRDPDMPDPHGLGAVWEWIQEKPLAVAGIGYMVSTLCHAVSTSIAWNYASNDRRKSVPFRAAFVGANIIAEILLAISSKGHGEGVKSDKSVDNTVIALAAEMIVQQPASAQENLIGYVARFLGRPDTLALKDEEVRSALRVQVEEMRKNPWALAAVAAQRDLPASRRPEAAAGRESAALWQSKVRPATEPVVQPSI